MKWQYSGWRCYVYVKEGGVTPFFLEILFKLTGRVSSHYTLVISMID